MASEAGQNTRDAGVSPRSASQGQWEGIAPPRGFPVEGCRSYISARTPSGRRSAWRSAHRWARAMGRSCRSTVNGSGALSPLRKRHEKRRLNLSRPVAIEMQPFTLELLGAIASHRGNRVDTATAKHLDLPFQKRDAGKLDEAFGVRCPWGHLSELSGDHHLDRGTDGGHA